MKSYIGLLLFSLFLPLLATAEVALKLVLPIQEVRQGALVNGRLEGDPKNLSTLPLQKLKSSKFKDIIYFNEVGPLLHADGDTTLSVPVGLIFIGKPDGQSLVGELGGTKVRIDLGSLQIIPTEIPSELIFGTFTIPARSRVLYWLGGLFLAILVITPLGLKQYKKWQTKKNHSLYLRQLRSELESANTYEEIVNVWKRKRTFVDNFPHIHDPFLKLEQVLFKYQFKPTQTEDEQNQVVNSYQEFKAAISGGFHGI